MTRIVRALPLLTEISVDVYCAEFVSQLLLWSMQQSGSESNVCTRFGQEIARISHDQIHFLPKQQEDMYVYDQEQWQQVPALCGIEAYGVLLMRTSHVELMPMHCWVIITRVCIFVLQTMTMQGIMERRIGKTSLEAKSLLKRLKPQEQRIVHAIVLGQSKEAIADAVCISSRTVETHQRNIYRKLEVSSATDVVIIVLLAGVVVSSGENDPT